MKQQIKTLTELESDILLEYLLDDKTSSVRKTKGIRNHTMAMIMLDSGLRVGELTHLLQTDLMINAQPVTAICVRAEIAKNKDSRLVPCTQRLQRALVLMHRAWWSFTNSLQQPYAFYELLNFQPLSARQVERIIRAAGMISLQRSIHPHILRHTFGSRLMRTTNLRVVQELLGHKHVSSTQIYTHPNGADLKTAIEKMENHTKEKEHTL